MQVKLFFADEGQVLVLQLGDDQEDQKGVAWDLVSQATEEEPFTFTFADDPLNPKLGHKEKKKAIDPVTVRPEGEKPFYVQKRAQKEQAQEREDRIQDLRNKDEDVKRRKLEDARKMAEEGEAELTEGQRYFESEEERRQVEEEQRAAQEEGFQAADEEEQEAQEEIQDEEPEQVEEEQPEPEPPVETRRSRQGQVQTRPARRR